MSDEEIIKILKNCADYLSLNSMFFDAVRQVGWWIIAGLAAVNQVIEKGLTQVYKMLYFFSSDEVEALIDRYIVLIFALGGLALGYLGWMIIIRQKTDYNRMVVNFLIAITVLLALPWSMGKAADLVWYGQKDLSNGMSTSTQVIKANITDLYRLDNAGFDPKKMKDKNYIENDDDIHILNINEPVDTGGFMDFDSPLSGDGKDILTKKVVSSEGNEKLNSLQNRWVQDDEAYYRYSWHPFLMMLELAATSIAIFFTIFKSAQLIMELGLLKLLTMGMVFTDLDSGQRTKKLLLQIRNTFIVLYLIALTMKFYLLYVSFVADQPINGVVKVIAIIAAAFLVIDGPNIIEQLFGIDAGLSSATKAAMGLLAAGHMAKEVGKGLGNVGKAAAHVAKKTGRGAAIAAGATAGGAKGALDGFKARRNGSSAAGAGGPVPPGSKPGALNKAKTGASNKGHQEQKGKTHNGLAAESASAAPNGGASMAQAEEEAASKTNLQSEAQDSGDALRGFQSAEGSAGQQSPASSLNNSSGKKQEGRALGGFTASGEHSEKAPLSGSPSSALGDPQSGSAKGEISQSESGNGQALAGFKTSEGNPDDAPLTASSANPENLQSEPAASNPLKQGTEPGQALSGFKGASHGPNQATSVAGLAGALSGAKMAGQAGKQALRNGTGVGNVLTGFGSTGIRPAQAAGSRGAGGPVLARANTFGSFGSMRNSGAQAIMSPFRGNTLAERLDGSGVRRAINGMQPSLSPTHANLPPAVQGSAQRGRQALALTSQLGSGMVGLSSYAAGSGVRNALNGTRSSLAPTHANLPPSIQGAVNRGKMAVAMASGRVPTTSQTLGQAIKGGLINGYANAAQRVYDSAPLSAYRKAYDLTHNSVSGPPPASMPTTADVTSPIVGGASRSATASGLMPSRSAISQTPPARATTPSGRTVSAPRMPSGGSFGSVPAQLYEYSKHNRELIQQQFPSAQAVGSKSYWSSHGIPVQASAQPILISKPVTDRDGQVILNAEGKPAEYEDVAVYDISQTTITPNAIPKWLEKNVKNKGGGKK